MRFPFLALKLRKKIARLRNSSAAASLGFECRPAWTQGRMKAQLPLLEMDGSHKVMFTRIRELADKLIEAKLD